MEQIILLHGALGSSADLLPLAESLQNNGIQAHLLDFSGHGKNALPDELRIQVFVDDIKHYISARGLKNPALFGYSMGGYAALLMAGLSQYEGTIITLGTRLSWSQEFAAAEMQKLDPFKMEEKIPAFTARLLQLHGEKWKDVVRKTAGVLNDLGNNNYLSDEFLVKIKSRVVLGVGDRDNMADAADTLRISKVISKGDMYMLPRTKHQIESVDTDLLSHIISAIVRK